MTQKEFIEAALAGKPIIIVEYRSFKLETIKFRDKSSVTGQMIEKDTVAHACEAGDMQMRITEWLPDGADVKNLKAPFAKGQKCAFLIKGMQQDKGFFRAQGELVPVTEDAKK